MVEARNHSRSQFSQRTQPVSLGTDRDRLRWTSPPLFGAILICFLLPFITVSCQGEEATLTGVQLATGRGLEGVSPSLLEHIKIPDPFVIIAIACAVAGFILGFARQEAFRAAMAGAAGAVALATDIPFQSLGLDSLEDRLGYRLAVLLFLAGTAVNDVVLNRMKRVAFRRQERGDQVSHRVAAGVSVLILGSVVGGLMLVRVPADSPLILLRPGVVVVFAAVGVVYALVGSHEARLAREGRLLLHHGGREDKIHAAAVISLLAGIVAVGLPFAAGVIGWFAVLSLPAVIAAFVAGVRELRYASPEPLSRTFAATGIGLASLPAYVVVVGLALWALSSQAGA